MLRDYDDGSILKLREKTCGMYL